MSLLTTAEADDTIVPGAKLQVLDLPQFLFVNLLLLTEGAFMSLLATVVTDDLFRVFIRWLQKHLLTLLTEVFEQVKF